MAATAQIVELRPAVVADINKDQDAARWNAFRDAACQPWENLTKEWQGFFYLMGDDKKCSKEALDAAIDRAIPSIHPITEAD